MDRSPEESHDLLDAIDPKWREEFRGFVQTGEASDGFIEYMDASEDCKRALERSLAVQSASLVALAKARPAAQTSRSLAIAASLLLALIAGIVAWNYASVARQDAHQLAALKERNSVLAGNNERLEVRLERAASSVSDFESRSQASDAAQTRLETRLASLEDSKTQLARHLQAARARLAKDAILQHRDHLAGDSLRAAGTVPVIIPPKLRALETGYFHFHGSPLAIHALIDAKGRVVRILDSNADAGFDTRAAAAVRRAKFDPGLKCEAQPMWTEIEFATRQGATNVKAVQPPGLTTTAATAASSPPPRR